MNYEGEAVHDHHTLQKYRQHNRLKNQYYLEETQ